LLLIIDRNHASVAFLRDDKQTCTSLQNDS
jgi:hypothetical protein